MQPLRDLMKRKVFRTFVVSFGLVFVLPVCILMGYVITAMNTAQLERETANRLILAQYQSAVDGRFEAVMRMGDGFVVDDRVQYFVAVHNPLEHLNNTTTFEMLRTLLLDFTKQNTMTDEVTSAYVAFLPAGKVVSNAIADTSDFYRRKVAPAFGGELAWYTFLRDPQEGFLPMDIGGVPGVGYKRNIHRAGELAASVVVPMPREVIAQYDRFLPEGAQMHSLVYDRDGELLYATRTDTPPFQARMQDEASGTMTLVWQGQEQHVSWARGAGTSNIYVTMVPYAHYARGVNQLLWVSVGVLLLVLLGGLMLCLWLARRNYRPIHQLLSIVAGAGNAPGGDEFAYLGEAMRSLQNAHTQSTDRLRSQSFTMRALVLERLLKGVMVSDLQMEEDLLSVGVAFDHDYYAVSAWRVLSPLQDIDPALMRFAAQNVLEELFAGCFPDVQTLLLEEQIVLVFSVLPAQGLTWEKQAEECVQQAQDVLAAHFDCELCGAVSRAMQGYAGLHTAYLDARGMQAEPESVAYAWQQLQQPESEMEHGLSVAQEQRLIHLLAAGEEAEVDQLLTEIFAPYGQPPRWRRRVMTNDILCAYAKVLSPTRVTGAQAQTLNERIQLALGAEGSLEDVAMLQALAVDICALAQQESTRDRGTELAERVQAYIRQHAHDDRLSVAEIAAHVGISPSYATMHYKRQTHESMLDTIHRIRLEEAKGLLRDSRRSVEDIAGAVGYYNSAAFIRAFKRYEGITPGQYRTLFANPNG